MRAEFLDFLCLNSNKQKQWHLAYIMRYFWGIPLLSWSCYFCVYLKLDWITYLSFDFTAAFDHLRRGVNLSLNLAYNEPWGQMQPVRHILGALLFEQGEIEEAEAVYRADIKLWKDNMWGLLGLKLG